jgi:hypothetical protein
MFPTQRWDGVKESWEFPKSYRGFPEYRAILAFRGLMAPLWSCCDRARFGDIPGDISSYCLFCFIGSFPGVKIVFFLYIQNFRPL